MKKPRILFVDDDSRILSGLKRVLRNKNAEWDSFFVNGATEALNEMEKETFDVIVTDMRMPEMDGADLLTTVHKKYPSTARLVLSGHSEREMIYRAVGYTHIYLSKPCEIGEVERAIARVMKLRRYIQDPTTIGYIASLRSIPGTPQLYQQLITELHHDIIDMAVVSKIIKQDAGMTAKVLQLVNSSFFGHQGNTCSVDHAVKLLGFETIKTLALSVGVFGELDQVEVPGEYVKEMWNDSVMEALFARQIMQAEGMSKEIVDVAFSAGILHKIGQIVLAKNIPDYFLNFSQKAFVEGISLLELEAKFLDITNAQVGAYLLGLWGLPEEIVDTTAFYQTPELVEDRGFSTITAVYLADAFNVGIKKGSLDSVHLNNQYLEAIGVKDKINDWYCLCQVTAEEKLRQKFFAIN